MSATCTQALRRAALSLALTSCTLWGAIIGIHQQIIKKASKHEKRTKPPRMVARTCTATP
jgi:hypothetical protein